jgi:hypothetical protein
VSGRHRSMAGGWSRKMGAEGRWILGEAFVGVEGLLLNGMKMDWVEVHMAHLVARPRG